MNRTVFDGRYQVYCGFHLDVEAVAVHQARRDYLRATFGVSLDEATEAQLAEADEWALDEDNWSAEMDGVIPLHQCG